MKTEIEFTEEQGNMVRLLRWVLKNYYTGTDIEGMFMWENSLGEEFDSMQVVQNYLKQNIKQRKNNGRSNKTETWWCT
jgi:hypothetical protein